MAFTSQSLLVSAGMRWLRQTSTNNLYVLSLCNHIQHMFSDATTLSLKDQLGAPAAQRPAAAPAAQHNRAIAAWDRMAQHQSKWHQVSNTAQALHVHDLEAHVLPSPNLAVLQAPHTILMAKAYCTGQHIAFWARRQLRGARQKHSTAENCATLLCFTAHRVTT